MNTSFEALPAWLREPFVAIRESLTILFDTNHDQLARDVVASIPRPSGWSEEQLVAFDSSKAAILAGIDSLIAEEIASNPLNSPEAKAMLALAAERRAAR